MTEIVGKIHRRELCSSCRTLVEAYQRAYLCDECADEHDADEAVAVNSDKANLLVEEAIHEEP